MVNLGNQSLSESLQTCVFAARRPWEETLCNASVSFQQDPVFHETAGVSMSRTMSLLYVALFVIALLCKSSFSLNLTCGDALCVREKLNASDFQNEDPYLPYSEVSRGINKHTRSKMRKMIIICLKQTKKTRSSWHEHELGTDSV